jgi:hypothetical protein
VAEVVLSVPAAPSPDQLAFVETALRNSFKVSGVWLREGRLVVEHDDKASEAALQDMLRRLVFISKNINKDSVFHNDVPVRFTDDPQPALEASGQVIPLDPGFYTFQGDFLRVWHGINRAVMRIAADFGAIEQEHPAVWPVKLFKMIDYFTEFPQQMILCAPVKSDFASRALFSKLYAKDQAFETVEMGEHMASASYGLQPAVCDCSYYVLRGSRTHRDAYYTTFNKVFRNERSATQRLDRLTSFSVRDIMFVGGDEFVLEAREKLIEALTGLLQSLRLQAKIETANDPFFANESAMKSVFQAAHKLKYELLARIPHLDKDIAVGSINLHKDFFGRALDIQMHDGRVASSGCIGVGMERMAYALFCQHGPDLAQWPQEVCAYLGV